MNDIKKSSVLLGIAVFLGLIAFYMYASKNVDATTIVFAVVALILVYISQGVRKNEEKKKKQNNQSFRTVVQPSNNSIKTPINKPNVIINKPNTENIKSSFASDNKQMNNAGDSETSVDEEYIKYIMANNHAVTRDEVVRFLSVVDLYDRTSNKQKALEAFDTFIKPIASGDLMHATMVCGFFCGLLGSNISLSNDEVNMLSNKYHEITKQQIVERGGIFN